MGVLTISSLVSFYYTIKHYTYCLICTTFDLSSLDIKFKVGFKLFNLYFIESAVGGYKAFVKTNNIEDYKLYITRIPNFYSISNKSLSSVKYKNFKIELSKFYVGLSITVLQIFGVFFMSLV